MCVCACVCVRARARVCVRACVLAHVCVSVKHAAVMPSCLACISALNEFEVCDLVAKTKRPACRDSRREEQKVAVVGMLRRRCVYVCKRVCVRACVYEFVILQHIC